MRCGLLSLLALTPLALADVEFTYPAAGLSLPAGAITVKWEDSGVAPAITALKSYTLQLMLGGNTPTEAQSLVSVTGTFATGDDVVLTVTPTLSGTATNGFYLEMISTATDGGTVTNFSDRFTITGMTGITSATITKQIAALGGSTTGPPTIDDVTPAAGGSSSSSSASASASPSSTSVAGVATTKIRTKTTTTPPAVVPVTSVAPAPAAAPAEYTVPYNLQTGLYRYAPMQPIPPTKITADNPTPLFPTSAFDVARSPLPPATILTTMTLAQTFSVQSIQNTIAAQSVPTGDAAKFLARWKD